MTEGPKGREGDNKEAADKVPRYHRLGITVQMSRMRTGQGDIRGAPSAIRRK